MCCRYTRRLLGYTDRFSGVHLDAAAADRRLGDRLWCQARMEEIQKQTGEFEWIALVQERLLSRQYGGVLTSSSALGEHYLSASY
ncbi:hypothetical protein KM043_008286 [Ampulex compressa]|nr:hypothetical protein KM043_008286 [Ampulex compressa]